MTHGLNFLFFNLVGRFGLFRNEDDHWKNLDLLLEYKYTYVKVKDASITHGHAETELETRHFVFGVGKRF